MLLQTLAKRRLRDPHVLVVAGAWGRLTSRSLDAFSPREVFLAVDAELTPWDRLRGSAVPPLVHAEIHYENAVHRAARQDASR